MTPRPPTALHLVLALLALSGVHTATASPADPVCNGDVCFVDRAATGEITIGNQLGGFGVLDYDRDGYADLVFANSVGVGGRLFRNVADPSRPGRRTFLDVTAGSGIGDADGALRESRGVVTGDYDGDGDTDIYMTGGIQADFSFGSLYRNNGNASFTNVSAAAGVRRFGFFPDSASFTDFDLDGDLDLLVAGPHFDRPLRLFVNGGNGTFSEPTGLLPSVASGSSIYASVWTDYDADGDPDAFLLTTGSSGPVLLRNDVSASGQHSFQNGAPAAGFTVLGPAPMGMAAGDYDGDGDFDLAITDAATGTYYRNDGGGVMTRLPLVTSIFGWGVTWLDADNDGDLDMYQAGSWRRPNFDKLFRNLGGGAFEDVSPALNGTFSASRYAASVDIDNDGRMDIVTINPGTPGEFVSVYENASPSTNAWVRVVLRGSGGVHPDAVGAVVRLRAGGRTQTREIVNGSSTSSTEDQRLLFGLGPETAVEYVEVVWPRAGTLATRTERYPGPLPLRTTLTLSPHDPSDPCNDGLDQDGDGRTDYPADTGCVAATDPSEAPECSDGLDNDGDRRIDHPQDLECASPDGSRETFVSQACGLLGAELLAVPIVLGAFRRRAGRS